MTIFEFLYIIGCGYAYFLALKLSNDMFHEHNESVDIWVRILGSGIVCLASWGFVLFVKSEKGKSNER